MFLRQVERPWQLRGPWGELCGGCIYAKRRACCWRWLTFAARNPTNSPVIVLSIAHVGALWFGRYFRPRRHAAFSDVFPHKRDRPSKTGYRLVNELHVFRGQSGGYDPAGFTAADENCGHLDLRT